MDDVNKDKDNADLPFGFRQRAVSDRLREDNWKGVEEAIRGHRGEAGERGVVRGIGHRRVIMLARVIGIAASVMAIAFGIWWIGARTGHLQYSEIRTGYGEIKSVLLRDSSVVTLNANSTMRIPEQWTEASGRQVWLDGEAYFQVQKRPATAEKFVVHTKEVDVEVLGTKFNVNARRQRAVVSLEEGKVRLRIADGEAKVLEKPMIMRPGEVAVVDSSRRPTVNEDKDVATRSTWMKHEFHFDNTPLKDIASMIEDTYGYRMEVEDPAMLQDSISGDVGVRNVEEMAKVLAGTSGYAMRIKDKTIYVTFH
jgi:transmembrane sensor